MTACVYTIKDIESIAWSCKDQLLISQSTLDLINSLTEQVSSPNYVKTPSFTNNDKPFPRKKKRVNDNINDVEDWESIRTFKKTEIVKKDGVQKDIDNLRLLINKMTDRTYDKIIVNINETLQNILETGEYDDNSLNLIGYAIFNMATNNKFNSSIYARLCNELKNNYEFMSSIIEHNIKEFMKLFENMEFVLPDENYDKFCEINILNEKRRSMSLFLCNLHKNNVIGLECILQNINNVQGRIMAGISNENSKMEIEELSENLFILLTNTDFKLLSSHEDWANIHQNINCIKGANIQNQPGITHKTKFKHMDMLDKCK